MTNIRIIPRLDIKGFNLIKGIQLEGLRVIGSPNEYAKSYYQQGADELLLMDCVASLYGRKSIIEIIEKITKDIFVPITVGGGIRNIEDATIMLRSGADKIAVNTAAVKNPNFISQIAQKFGKQCMVLSVEAKFKNNNWEAYIDNGREKTGLDVISWVSKAIQLGAGEILLTSVDKEGTKRGFDISLIKAISKISTVPVIASGGMGDFDHFAEAVLTGKANAISMASVLHYKKMNIQDIRNKALTYDIKVRNYESR